MFMIHVLLYIAAIPLPEGSRLMFEMVRPSFASIAVSCSPVHSCMHGNYVFFLDLDS